ncbi:MAG: GldG family protein [Patescibacteria group bacterium]|jgi:gliding-associated putative ABC transporter substrate-binding component GldG
MLNNIKKKYFANSAVAIIAVIGIVALLNILAVEIFHRFDITQDKEYSLSTASKNTLKDLSEKVTVNVYFSEKLPPEYLTVRQKVEDMLKEYKTYGKGKIEVNYIDPKDDEDMKQELMMKGIPELQFNVMEKDQFQLTTGYLGLTVDYLDQEEVLPVIEDTSAFEYDMTSAIKKVVDPQNYSVGWFSKSETYTEVLKELKTNYKISEVDITEGKLLDNAQYKALIVVAVEEELTDKSKYVLDQFIMKGGSVMFLLDAVKVDQGLQATPNKTGLEEMLAGYGVTMKKNLVLDSSSEIATFQGGYTNFMVQYPYWVKVQKDGFASDNAAVSQLESATFPWVGALDISNGKPLVISTKKSWLSPEAIDLNPQQDFAGQNLSQNNLAAVITGQLNSFYKDKDKPAEMDTKDFKDTAENGRVVVVADADFISDMFVGQFPGNYVFLANMIDWLNQDESLIAIRSKGISDRALKTLTDQQKASIKYGNIFGLTAIVIVIGAIRFITRRKRIRKIKFKL